jgi:hypothetical protein
MIIDDRTSQYAITLAYCDICNTPVVFNATTHKGIFTFEPTNLVLDENSLMIDSETRSVWNKITGKPILGKLIAQNIELELLAFEIVEP